MAILIVLLIFAAGVATGFVIRAQISAQRHRRAKKLRHMYGNASTQ